MKRLTLLAAVAAVLALSSVAWAAGRPSGTYERTVQNASIDGGAKGTWRIAFKRAGYAVSYKGNVIIRGRDRVEGNKITFTDISGPYKCSGTGTYKYTLTKSTVRFAKVRETSSCAGRAIVLSGTFKKVM